MTPFLPLILLDDAMARSSESHPEGKDTNKTNQECSFVTQSYSKLSLVSFLSNGSRWTVAAGRTEHSHHHFLGHTTTGMPPLSN
ncbi:hypothetical protein BDW42DRAFT_169272 [Aspergillus taichungensis]|uniref:Uncharacterized protein n=1 Tax=Aspergillus taichungensis TaxID=482145 RepID=A0A2J5HVD5_9EURO|nr:hypothetical protein BDW42DRAFT_169272 [Aspergillus taichungensis]